jgi:hypothetical protein
MVEHHMVRQGLDEQAISDFLRARFESVRIILHWSNQIELVKRLGQHFGVDNTIGVIATGVNSFGTGTPNPHKAEHR